MIAALALIGILSALALLHFGWATGRGPSLVGVVPSQGGRPLFDPGPVACVAMGLALSVAVLLCVMRAGWLLPGLPAWLSQTGVGGVALAFGLRAIGDFRYVGFSKRVRDGEFARRDTWLYSPLCVVVSSLAVALAWP